jgi:hypothetical protein
MTSLGQPLVIRSTTLKRYHESFYRMEENAQISPSRLIYEIVTAFSTPLSIRGNTWTSGTRVFLVDAQTGHRSRICYIRDRFSSEPIEFHRYATASFVFRT